MVFFNRTNFGEVRSKRDKRALETEFGPFPGLRGSVAFANSFEILKETRAIFRARTSSRRKAGGEGGIRTHGTVARTSVFETDPFDRSGTSPAYWGSGPPLERFRPYNCLRSRTQSLALTSGARPSICPPLPARRSAPGAGGLCPW